MVEKSKLLREFIPYWFIVTNADFITQIMIFILLVGNDGLSVHPVIEDTIKTLSPAIKKITYMNITSGVEKQFGISTAPYRIQ